MIADLVVQALRNPHQADTAPQAAAEGNLAVQRREEDVRTSAAAADTVHQQLQCLWGEVAWDWLACHDLGVRQGSHHLEERMYRTVGARADSEGSSAVAGSVAERWWRSLRLRVDSAKTLRFGVVG